MPQVPAPDYEKHCPGCFYDKAGQAVCPRCGYDESEPRSPLYLPHGEVIGRQYRIGRVLGKPGGFGITYLGWDVNLQQRVAIKEFLPRDIASREGGRLDVICHTAHDREGFEYGRDQFVREARTVAKLDHPNVVRVRGFFRANNTAYLVMDYYEGVTLGEFLTTRSRIEPRLAQPLLLPVLEGLEYVHQRGVVHRDVKPHNIYLASIGRLILLDFGAARQATGDHVQSISVMLTEGYAPLEQYQRRAAQGPWTDVYGLAATLYRTITGQVPPVALERLGLDPLFQNGLRELPEAMRPVMKRALAVHPDQRYATAAEFHDALAALKLDTGLTTTYAPAEPAVSTPEIEPDAVTRLRPVTTETQIPAPAPDPAPRAPAPGLTSTVPAPAAADTSHAATAELPFRPLLIFTGIGTIVLAVFFFSFYQPPASSGRVYRAAGVVETRSAEGVSVLAPQMLNIPAGELRMGDEAGRANERPVHPLQISAFKLSAQEISVAQFGQFVTQAAYTNPAWVQQPCQTPEGTSAGWQQPGYDPADNDPVTCVSWEDARAYARWLSAQTGARYRLPTESEWEYAARGGTRSANWWGNGPPPAGHARCSNCQPPGQQPQATGSTPPNPFGLTDTSGNVREWTCSVFASYGSGAETVCGTPGDDARIAVRGGSWAEPSTSLRSAYRDAVEPAHRDSWTGFRLARD